MALRAAIIGASGYTGGELLRLLSMHPEVEVTVATSREHAGKPVHFVHFNLRGYYRGLKFTRFNLRKIADNSDVVFLALPHGVSLNYVPQLLEVGLMVVDLSADYRLRRPEDYKLWYGFEHPHPDLLAKAVYGMPELHRNDLAGAKLIASPGCNATASLLALLPIAKERLVELDKIICDVKVGSSEGGSKPTLGSHHPEREGCMRPYSASGHRHAAEVEQELEALTGSRVRVSLVPHAVGSVRGTLASAHVWADGVDKKAIWKAYVKHYSGEPFVRVVKGMPPDYPDPKYVVGSNYADVSFAVEPRAGRVTAFCAIDNLVKGAAGQAVQAFNVAAGFDERLGLEYPPPKPV